MPETPRTPSGADVRAGRNPAALAHRGFSPDGHENTMAAFRAAAELGFVWLETDVHTTSDGVVVAFHDPTLERVTGTDGDVNEFTWEQLRELRVGGEHGIPTLTELLRELPDACLNIDVKDEASVAALPEVLAREGAADRVRVTSFSESRRRRTLARTAHLTGRRVRTSAGTLGTAGFLAVSAVAPLTDRLSPRIATALWAGHRRAWARVVAPFDTLQLPERHTLDLPLGRKVTVRIVSPRFLEFAHREGIAVQVWTVNEPADMHRLLDMGVDGLITDRADLLRAVLEQRGQWPPDAQL
ncbi:glycerophosphodiester phosphodiesterase family protein [Kocuria rhizophila]|uniref:glycerophosphodiester phosphodiesterase family protein n=1 Tax=Kocuria rhizophila TaxID=72000 RepID=UPI00386D81FF|nr:glycerophosphodiester phosphodiesterase family protein [Kocuria rhizophila]WSZ53731.1 glycerophosphodiester phosphodiesterase family protein [Kocuria rhizophila]